MNDKKQLTVLNKGIRNKVIEHPALYAQAPNRYGNQSKMIPDDNGGRMGTTGATNQRSDKINLSQPKGAQGAPSASGMPIPKPHPDGCRTGCTNVGPVKLSQPPKKYAASNLGYIAKNNLKFGG